MTFYRELGLCSAHDQNTTQLRLHTDVLCNKWDPKVLISPKGSQAEGPGACAGHTPGRWIDLALLLFFQVLTPSMHHLSDVWSPWATSEDTLPALVGHSASSEHEESLHSFGSWQGEGDSTEAGTCLGVKSNRWAFPVIKESYKMNRGG